MTPVLSGRRMRACFPCHIGLPTGPVHGQLLRQPVAGHRGQAAADSQCACGEPAGLAGSCVAGPAGQSGFRRQLGSLCFSSASSGENLQWDLASKYHLLVLGVLLARSVCVCACVHARISLYVMVLGVHLWRCWSLSPDATVIGGTMSEHEVSPVLPSSP